MNNIFQSLSKSFALKFLGIFTNEKIRSENLFKYSKSIIEYYLRNNIEIERYATDFEPKSKKLLKTIFQRI